MTHDLPGSDAAEAAADAAAPGHSSETPQGDDAVAGRVVRGGAQRIAGLAGANILIAASTVLLLRHLGVEGFGQYGTVMALMTIITGLTDAGLNVIGTRELALVDSAAGRRKLTSAILGIRLVLATLGVGIAVLFALASGYDSVMVLGAAITGIGVVGISAQAALSLSAQAELRNGPLAVIEVARAAIAAGLTAIFVASGFGLVAYFWVQAAIGIGVLALLPLILGAGAMVAPRYDRDEWKRVISAALPVAIAGVLSVLYLRIVIVLASLMVNDYETGLLATSTRLVEVVAAVPLTAVGVLLPVATIAARDNPKRFQYVTQKMLESGVLLGIAAALGFGFGAHALVVTLGSDQYAAAAPVLAIQGLTILTVFIAQTGVIVLVATHHQQWIIRANLAGLVTVFVAAFLLLSADGARGGAIATVIADVVLAVSMVIAARRAGARFTSGLLPRAVIAGLIGTGAGLLALPLPSLATALIALIAFAAAAAAVRAIPSEIIDTALRRTA